MEVTYLTSLGIVPASCHLPPTSFPRTVEFEEFDMIQHKSSLGMFVAFQRTDSQLRTEVGYVRPGATTVAHFSFHGGIFPGSSISRAEMHPS